MAGGVACRLFEGGTNRYHEARISIYGRTVRIDPSDRGIPAVVATVSQIEFDRPVAGLPMRITFEDGRIAEVDDSDTFLALISQADGKAARRLRGPSFSLTSWVVLIVLAVSMPVAVWFTYPVAADAVALSLPRSVDRAMGQGVFDQLDGRLFQPSQLDRSVQDKYRAIFTELVGVSGIEDQDARLLFRRSDRIGANALALPDGTIVLLDELVRLAEHEDEIAGVLAHEIGHVEHRHALRKSARAIGLTLIVTFALGDTVSIIEELAAVGAGVAELSFSREFELEADAASREIMTDLGRDPAAMIYLLRRIHRTCGEDCEETSLLSTHPGLRDRLEAIEEAQ